MPENDSNHPRTVFHTRKSAAEHLTKKQGAPISEATLAKWAVSGDGPPYRVIGRNAIYEEPDLDVFALGRLTPKISSSSELVHGPGWEKPKGRPPQKAIAPVETEQIGQSRKRGARKVEPVA
jgi:hypothetical protein